MSYNVLVASEPTRYRPHNLKRNILYGGRFVKRLFEKTLLLQIGIKRKVMYRRAKTFGYTHPLVVECSQELDVLINRYQESIVIKRRAAHPIQDASLSSP
jgi:stage 0 sporulation regulatory protein